MKKKSHSSAKKRLKVTASGKVRAYSTNRRHLKLCKSQKSIRQSRRGKIIAKSFADKLKEVI